MAWTGDMNKYGLKYEILYPNEVWKDVSCLVSSPKMTVTENLFSSSFKSVISTTKLDLRYNNDTQKDLQQEIFSKMMEAKANFDRIGFRIKETATGKFPMNGFIDLSNITMVVGRLPRELSIEVENLITALDDDIQGSFQYPDIPVFDEKGKMNEGYCVYDPNDSANSIIPLLIMRCGLNITDLDMVHSVEILEKVPRIVYDADANTRTYRDLIDTLLYEHCAVLRQSDNGKLVISSFTYEKPEALREIAYTTENGLTMKGGDWQKDGWKIEWSTVDAVRQATVYQASITPKYDDKGEVLDSGEEIEALGYFPETGDLEPEYYEFDAKFLDRPYYTKQSRLKNKDLSLITTSNVTYELEADDRIEEVVAVRELHPLKARILLHNSDSDDVHFIRMFNMLGDCLFRKKINTYTYPEDAKKTEEYTTEFVTDEKVVNKLGSTLTSLSTHGDNTYSWTEFGQRGTVGDIVQITAPGTNISSLAVITSVSCSKANTDVWRNEYKAIGLVAYNALEPKKRSVVSGASSVEGKQGTPGNIKVEQYAIGDAIAPFTTAPEGSQSPETSMFLYNIGGEGYVLGGSDWELGEDSSWSTDIPTPSEGEYVWLRVGFYTPPALFPTVWQQTRLTGLKGEAEKGVTIISTSDTLPTTSRGVPKIASIKFTALLKNMAITYASDITWECSDPAVTLVPVAGDIHSVLLYTSEVSTDSFFITAIIGATVGQKAIARVADGKPAPIYLGGVTEMQFETSDGQPLVKGDFFMVMEEFSYGTTVFKQGTLWEYDGLGWFLSDDAMKALDAMNDYVTIAEDAEDGVFCQVIAKRVIAQKAVIEELGTKEITLKTGGKIQSEIYDPGVAGFRFLADGTLDAIGASLVSGLFSGSIDSPPLTTTTEGDLGSEITFNSFSHWKGQDLFNGLSSLDGNKWFALSGTYGSQSITHLIKMPSDGTFQAYHNTGGYDSKSSVTFTYTIQHQGNYSFNISERQYYDHYKFYESVDFYVNNIKNTSYHLGLDLQVGDVVRIYFAGASDWGVTPQKDSAVFTVLQNIPAGVRVENSSNVYHFPLNKYFSDRLNLPSLTIDTSTPTYNRYAKATAFLAGVSSYSINVFKTAQGTANIRGTDRNIIGVMRTTTGMTLFHSAGSEVLIPTISDPGTSGYYNISGFYQVQATVEGAATQNLNAKLSDTYSIGGVARYLNIAGKTMIAENYDSSSSREKKKDISPFIQSALEILDQVSIVNYRYKTDNGEYLHTGFIAEDTPDILTGVEHKSMSLSDNIGILIKAVQELNQRLKQLEAPTP